jgi:hypothetical protein
VENTFLHVAHACHAQVATPKLLGPRMPCVITGIIMQKSLPEVYMNIEQPLQTGKIYYYTVHNGILTAGKQG